MHREPVDLLAATLLEKRFPVERLRTAADGMLEMIRERIGRLSLVETRDVLPMLSQPHLRQLKRLDARTEADELHFYEDMFASRKRLARVFAKRHGPMLTLRMLKLPEAIERADGDAAADKAWEDARWIIHEGVVKPYVDDALSTAVHRNLLLQLLTREIEEELGQDPAELLSNQLTTAVSDRLFAVAEDDAKLLRGEREVEQGLL